MERGIASFVVRFVQERWRDTQGEPHLQWRGQIQHVQGSEEAPFTDFADAVAFMQQHLNQLTSNALPGGTKMEQEKMMRESFKLWEQFTSTYSNMMLEAMEKNLKQSEAIKQQVDEAIQQAMKGWQMPGQAGAGNAQLIEAIGGLQAQIQALTTKIDGLEKTIKKMSKE